MKKNTNPKLTVKQRSFINHYLANGGNGTQAARDAGYKGSDTVLAQVSAENLRKPHIAEAIEAEQNKLKTKLEITAEWKREMLRDVAVRSMQGEPVLDKNGNPVGEWQFKGGDVVRAINELNKMDGDHAAQKIKAEIDVIDHVAVLEAARARAKKV